MASALSTPDADELDLSGVDMDAAEDELVTLHARTDAATFRKLELIRLIDVSGRWAHQGAKSCAHWLSWRLQLDGGAAREQVRVARRMVNLPRLMEEMRQARVSFSQARAMTRVATPENEQRLIDLARHSTAAQLERVVRGVRQVERAESAAGSLPPEPLERWVRERPMGDGTVRVEAQLMADEAALVMEAIRAVRARMKSEQREATDPSDASERPAPSFADAIVRMAEEVEAARRDGDAPTATRTGGERTSVVVHLAPGVLGDGYVTQLGDGSNVSAETFRRLACDCSLITVSEDEHGDPLDVGRKTRSIPPALQRAVSLRDRGCLFPGCTHDRFIDCHHVLHWAHGGETKKDNLASLCVFHHHFVHEGGWSMTFKPGSGATFTMPNGRVLPPVCTVDVGRPAQQLIAELALEQEPLGLDAETAYPMWDGRTPDYDMCVEMVGHFNRRDRDDDSSGST